MEDSFGILVGFFLGIVSSWLFWRWQLLVKPNFKVSPKISVWSSQTEPTQLKYQIKIINLSSRPIVGMKANLGIHEINASGKGPGRTTIYSVKLNPSQETIIGPYKRKYDPWSITSVHYYTSEPDTEIEKSLGNDRRLVFTVQATDATSGTITLQRFTYTSKDIVHGRFESGRGWSILPFEQKQIEDSTTEVSVLEK